jgi:NitT/TauT family transport system permease protein
MKHILDRLWYYSPLLLLCLVWEAGSRFGLVSAYVLPPLGDVASAGVRIVSTPTFYSHLLVSVERLVAGLGAALIFGTIIGWLMASIRPIEEMVSPVVQIFYPLPKSALIPLTLLWFGLGEMSKIFPIFLGCMLPVILSTYNGVRAADRVLKWSAASLGASRAEIMFDIGLRAAVPDILAGVRTALSFAFSLLVSAELLISNQGLGYLIRLYGDSSLYPDMFVVILFVAGLGFVCDRAYLKLSTYLLRWRG